MAVKQERLKTEEFQLRCDTPVSKIINDPEWEEHCYNLYKEIEQEYDIDVSEQITFFSISNNGGVCFYMSWIHTPSELFDEQRIYMSVGLKDECDCAVKRVIKHEFAHFLCTKHNVNPRDLSPWHNYFCDQLDTFTYDDADELDVYECTCGTDKLLPFEK